MQSFAEQYRPATLADYLGNPKAVAAARFWLERGLGGLAFWISGASGVGKTTLAKILAAQVAAPLAIEEYDSADQLDAGELRRIGRDMYFYGPHPGGRVYIVNEAHGLSKASVRGLLGLLERLPAHVTFIFTTTRQGEAQLFDGIDGRPLVDRCKQIPLSSQGLAPIFAARLVDVGQREGFTVPLAKAREVISDGNNSLRAGLDWLGTPQSMAYLTAATEAAA
ncbi:MAG: hypothetical protein PHU85_00400 [Phycisphaerae bacterium]|nr:hypothetical protein [Phycisphaerae bacterium]